MKIPPHIKAIIFDYDGVLGDSTPFNTYACKESAKKCGINLEAEVYQKCAPGGATIHDIATCIVTHYGMPEKVSEFITYKKQFDTDYVKQVQILPNASLCVALLSKHYPLAVNTGTRHILVDSFLNKYDLTKYIFTTIAAEDISRGKPDPESYLLACQKLAHKPESCLVVEDGISGVVAAKKAGCYTVGITNDISKQKLYELGCDKVITDLSELMVPISTS